MEFTVYPAWSHGFFLDFPDFRRAEIVDSGTGKLDPVTMLFLIRKSFIFGADSGFDVFNPADKIEIVVAWPAGGYVNHITD